MSMKSSLIHDYALFKSPAGSQPVITMPLWGWLVWLGGLPLFLIGLVALVW